MVGAGGRRAGEEVDVDAADAPGAELDVARARALRGRPPGRLPRRCETSDVASARAAPSAKTPALGVPWVATSPMAYTPGIRVASVAESTRQRSRLRSGRSPHHDARAPGASARRGRGRTADSLSSSSTTARRSRDRAPLTLLFGISRMSRSSNAVIERGGRLRRGRHGPAEGEDERDLAVAADAALDETRRAASATHSLGAGGHLNGAPQTPTTTRPSVNSRIASRMRHGAFERVELVAATRAQAGRPGQCRSRRRAQRRAHPPRACRQSARDALGLRVDGRDRLPQQAHARLHELLVRAAARSRARRRGT